MPFQISAMPTVSHLLLVLACLLLGPLAATADELPKDTNKIESLTVEQARRLVETFPGVEVLVEIKRRGKVPFSGCLPLNGVQSLDAQTAGVLAKYNKGPLLLNGMTTLSPEAAKALAEILAEPAKSVPLCSFPIGPGGSVN
jgi:hypothetical protein